MRLLGAIKFSNRVKELDFAIHNLNDFNTIPKSDVNRTRLCTCSLQRICCNLIFTLAVGC